MNNNPFFSIVIPVYNSEKYLNECIESVVNQTCQDFEIILVDDESKDSSVAICDEWAGKYPQKIHVIHQKNTGVYIAKRNGIKASVGMYIYVIDNDDLITTPKALETIKRKIQEEKCDLVVFNATDNVETGHLLCRIPFTNGQIFENNQLSQIYEEYLSTKNLHHIWMMIFARELFDWEYEYKEPFRMLRDGPMLILPILSNAQKIIYLEDTFYYWRIQNQASASKHYDVINFFYSIRVLHERILSYSNEWKYKTKETNDLVKANYITDVCIAAVKVRGLSQDSKISKRECLKMMAEDVYFKKEYSLKKLENFRKPIAWALYHKQFWLVKIVSTIIGTVKGR